MATVQAQRYCPRCDGLVLASKRTPNHILHLLLTVLLLGAWAIVWLIVALTSNEPYLCHTCGSVTYPPNQRGGVVAPPAERSSALTVLAWLVVVAVIVILILGWFAYDPARQG